VKVPARGGTSVRFPGIPPGNYSIEVDGKRFSPTLSVVAEHAPRSGR